MQCSSASSAAKCPVILVEGNISAGKSTLCAALARETGYTLFLEATVENPFLVRYYDEPTKYALPMQLWLLKQRYVTYVTALRDLINSGAAGVILDRSIFSDWVFAAKNFADANFSGEGFDYYLAMRDQLLEGLPMPDAVIYLDVAPEECHRRVHCMRKRACEDGIPLAYLAGLDECYARLCAQLGEQGVPVLRLPWNEFGSTADVAAEVRRAVADAEHAWPAELREFVNDAAAVEARMRMSHTVPEAEGSDVAVADPKLLSAAEAVSVAEVAPPSPPDSPMDRGSPSSAMAQSPVQMAESPVASSASKLASLQAEAPAATV